MPALNAIISGTSQPLQKELRAVERLAQQTGRNIQKNLQGPPGHFGSSGVIREAMVLMREMSAGNWTRVPGSLSILLQRMGVLKLILKESSSEATILAQAHAKEAQAAALAAVASTRKAAASTAALYAENGETEANLAAAVSAEEKAAADIQAARSAQAKAAASTEAAAAMTAEGGAASFALGPLGWLAIAVVAVGTAAYFTVRHILKLREEQKFLNDLMDTSTVKFTSQAQAMRHAVEAAAEFNEWLRKLSSSEEDLASQTEDAIEALREQHKAQRRIAESKGAGKKELAQMDVQELQKELAIVTRAKLLAGLKLKTDNAMAAKLEAQAKDPDREAKLTDISAKTTVAAQIAEAIQQKVNTERVNTGSGAAMLSGGSAANATRPASAYDKFKVTVGGQTVEQSYNEALANYNALFAQEKALIQSQKQTAARAARAAADAEKDKADEKRFGKEQRRTQFELDAKKNEAQETEDKPRNRVLQGHVNAMQQVGAYVGPAGVISEKNEKAIPHHLKALHATVQSINKKMPSPHANPRPFGGVHY